MSFYSVPTLSYQQQQKLKQNHKKGHRRDPKDAEDKDEARSIGSRSERKSSVGSKQSDSGHRDSSSRSKSRRSSKDTLASNFMSQLSLTKADDRSVEGRNSQDQKSNSGRRTSIISVPSFVSGRLSSSQRNSVTESSTPEKIPSLESIADSNSRSTKAPEKQRLPRFGPAIDLSYLNSSESVKHSLPQSDYFQQKFHRFLNSFGDHHVNDPINFASVRDQSFRKFVSRQRISKQYLMAGGIRKDGDARYYEDLLLYKVLEAKNFVRRLTNNKLTESQRQITVNSSEELVQGNLGRYLNFVMSLPDSSLVPKNEMNQELQYHFDFKNFLIEVSDNLFTLKKKGFEDISMPSSRLDFLYQIIEKSADEFTLLEKYVIQILVKLNNNSLIEGRILKNLVPTIDPKQVQESRETPKVLHYNTYFSSQYSWHLALTIPFVRVIESSVLTETKESMENAKIYSELSNSASQTDFRSSDSRLYDEFFRETQVQSYEQIMKLSKRELLEFQKTGMSPRQNQTLDDPTSFPSGPRNFEYYSGSLSSICSNTFDVIHSRDFPLQVQSENLSLILGEFFRLLKKGGVLELPLFLAGDMITDFHGSAKYSEKSEFTSLGFKEQPFFIARFIERLLKLLDSYFGTENVKFSSLILSNKNEMNNLLIKHTAFMSYEIFGRLDEFCNSYGEDESLINDDTLHIYFYIRAQKS